jgi:hypothetical protein
MHVLKKFGLRGTAFAFGSRMQDDMGTTQSSSGFAGEDDLSDRSLARGRVEGSDVDAVGEWRVEGHGINLQLTQALGRKRDGGVIMIIEMSRKGADFDLVEVGRFDRV